MDALECMKTRRSIRAYRDESVPREVIEDIVDCGRLAATAVNIQPWQFVAVTNGETISRLADMTDHGKFIAQAPVCIVVLCQDCKYYLEDGCAATQNILNAAHAHGLGACWVAGDKKPYADQVVKLLGLPDGYKLISLISIGYPAEKRDREKRPLAQVLHWEQYSGSN